MTKHSKKRSQQEKLFADKHSLPAEKAIDLVRSSASANFDETVEVAVNLGVDPRHADQVVRGVCSLPNGSGKSVRVAVFARGEKAEEAKKAGADIVGAEDLMESIQAGNLNFDRCIASPDMMPLVGRLGKVLGPRNLMPNPKVGTVTPAGIGKVSFDSQKLVENFKAFIAALNKSRPSGAKGIFIKKISISSTMGKSMVVDNEL